MDIKRKISGQNKLKKIFGIGPTGAINSDANSPPALHLYWLFTELLISPTI